MQIKELNLKSAVDKKLRSAVNTVTEESCSKDFVGDDEPPVDAHFYELLAKRKGALEKTIRTKQILSDEKDTLIETLKQRLEGMLEQHHGKLVDKEMVCYFPNISQNPHFLNPPLICAH